MEIRQRFLTVSGLLGCLLLLTSPRLAAGEDQALRRDVAELSSLLAHYAVRLSVPEVSCFHQDSKTYRETAERLARDGVSAEIREIAEGCRQNIQEIELLATLWEELRSDTPAPESQFWKLQDWVWNESAKGSFQTEVTEYSNGIAMRSYTTDNTLTVAAGAAVVGMMMDHVAQQKYVAGEIQRKRVVASRMGKLGDSVEQRRLQLQQKLLTSGYIPVAGPKQTQPILEARIAWPHEVGSPIEEWEKERKRQAWIEQQTAASQPLNQSVPRPVSGPQLRLRNSGPPLHRVALRIDYKHYRHPETAVVRQTYFIEEWPAGEEIEIIDEFRLNASNRATAGFFEDILSPNEGLGMRVMPGFQGVVELSYALASDELLQGPVTLSLDQQRAQLAKHCLEIAEHWSWSVTQGNGPLGPLTNLPPPQRTSVQNLMKETIKKFAEAALALRVLDPEQTKLAESLSKSPASIAKRSKDLQTELLAACRPGRTFSTQIIPQRAGGGLFAGVYDLTFSSDKPTANKIDAVLTRRGSASAVEQKTAYTGRLEKAPTGPGWVLELQLARTTTTMPDIEPRPLPNLLLTWQDDSWRYGPDPDQAFTLTHDEPPASLATPSASPPSAPVGRNTTRSRLPLDSIWEGTRQFVDSRSGQLLREEKIVVTIRKSWRPTDMFEHFEGEFLFDDRFHKTGDITLALNGDIRLNPMIGRRGDPYHYPLHARLLGNKIEGAAPAGSGKPETELIRLTKKP